MNPESARKSEWGMRVVLELWPDFRRASLEEDMRQGVDAWDGQRPISIKTDLRIAETGNVEWELHKRNDGKWNSYGKTGGWRPSPVPNVVYDMVFISHGVALRVSFQILSDAVVGRSLLLVRDTSRGFLIPVAELQFRGADIRRGPWRYEPVAQLEFLKK